MALAVALVALCALAGLTSASLNGGFYQCRTADLTDGLCVFENSATAPWAPAAAAPHTISPRVGVTYELQDSAGKTLPVSPKPWSNGDQIAPLSSSDTSENYQVRLRGKDPPLLQGLSSPLSYPG